MDEFSDAVAACIRDLLNGKTRVALLQGYRLTQLKERRSAIAMTGDYVLPAG
jgi:hypothetical protein